MTNKVTLELPHGRLNENHCINVYVNGYYTVGLFGKGHLEKSLSVYFLSAYSPHSIYPIFVHNISEVVRDINRSKQRGGK